MATVELRFSALPEHVRTARLVAAAVARRAGVDEAVLDEVRLAVGEACTRAVGLHMSTGVDRPVRVALTEDEKKFSIEVGDEVPSVPSTGTAEAAESARGVAGGSESGFAQGLGLQGPPDARDGGASEPTGDEDEGNGQMGLAVISGLVDDVEVTSDENGGLIRMSWPTAPAPLLP